MTRWELCKIIFRLWLCAMLKPQETARIMLIAGQQADPELRNLIEKTVG